MDTAYWQGIVVAKPGNLLMGGAAYVRTSWFLDKQELLDLLYALSDQPTASHCIVSQQYVSRYELQG